MEFFTLSIHENQSEKLFSAYAQIGTNISTYPVLNYSSEYTTKSFKYRCFHTETVKFMPAMAVNLPYYLWKDRK